MLINCTVGEKGPANALDDKLVSLVHVAMIAAGGHAGDAQSIQYYEELAKQHNVKTCAYLSYPDKENHGLEVMPMSTDELIRALDEQLENFSKVECVRFHGALYHQMNRSAELAEIIADWLKEKGIKEVISPYRSMLHKACSQNAIMTHYEAYANRSYSSMNVGLELISKDQTNSVIDDIDAVVKQVRKMKQGAIEIDGQIFLMEVETICVDRQSDNILEVLQAILKVL